VLKLCKDINSTIERKRSKPRLCDEERKKVILGTENKRVLVLQ